MGNGDTRTSWVTKETYDHLFDQLAPEAAARTEEQATEKLVMQGVIRADDTVDLYAWHKLTTTSGDSNFPGGTYRIEFEDAGGQSLAGYDFEMLFKDIETGEGTDAAPFSHIVRYPPNAALIRLKRGDTTIKTITVSDNPPQVTLTSPTGGESWDGIRTITWTASDTDGDDLTFTVLHSTNGSDWVPLASGVTGSSYTWDTTRSPGGPTSLIKVVASDGVHTSEDQSGGFFGVVKKGPLVDIQRPREGAQFTPLDKITLSGESRICPMACTSSA
jgi:hypothetical protein